MAELREAHSEVQLSSVLRRRLAPAHAALERAGGLPDRIRTLADYIGCLQMHHRLFSALEGTLAAYPDHAGNAADRASLLRDDLRRLGAWPDAPAALLWQPANAAQALGARYVLAGSALGGRVILAALGPRLGPQIAGATRFFAGHGRDSMANWQRFTAALDAYGNAHPDAHEDVVTGAAQCFAAFLDAAMAAASGVA